MKQTGRDTLGPDENRCHLGLLRQDTHIREELCQAEQGLRTTMVVHDTPSRSRAAGLQAVARVPKLRMLPPEVPGAEPALRGILKGSSGDRTVMDGTFSVGPWLRNKGMRGRESRPECGSRPA